MSFWFYPTLNNGVLVSELDSHTPSGGWHASNIEIIKSLGKDINVPLIYKGGAASINDIKKVMNTEANVFASSTLFIMKKLNGGIVFNYPSENEKREYGIL